MMRSISSPVEFFAAVACLFIASVTLPLQAAVHEASEAPSVGLSASLIAITPDGPANNVQLMWASATPCDQYQILRSRNQAGPFDSIYTGGGKSFNDYGLADGTYFYKLIASGNQGKLESNIASVNAAPLPKGLAKFSNQRANQRELNKSPMKLGQTYYTFRTVIQNRSFSQVIMKTSSDGSHWDAGTVVMDRNSHPDLANCKFESEDCFYDKLHDQFVWWAHWELAEGYANGKAVVATAKPGSPFKVHHIYNPLGVQVRDMSVFIDDDHRGYLVAASNVHGQGANATLSIFKLNETYDDAESLVAKVMENGYREAPHIQKVDGFYYLFFSQAAGWYPSQGGYVSSRSIEGPWSEARTIGNSSTFSAQSGDVIPFGAGEEHVPVMMANRWLRADGTSANSAMPVHFANGFAFYDYAPDLLFDSSKAIVIPLYPGRLLSQGKPAESSIPGIVGHEAAKAFDGSYDSSFQSDKKQWPFSLTSDLGKDSTLTNVQVSWYICKGSEAFYMYTIDGSRDGKQWSTFVDRSDANNPLVSKTYGFTSDLMPDHSVARYVRLTVKGAKLQNNPNNNWYPPTVFEVKVFGN